MSTQDESITPIERPTEGLVCNMPVVIEEKQKSTLKRPFETFNDASKECVDTDSLEGPVLSKRSKNAEVLSASTNITITEKLIPPVSNKTFKSNGLLTSADKQMVVDLWPPLEPDRFAGLLLLESRGASFLSIFENSFKLCGLQNYFYQCVPWGKGHICRLFVSNKMLAVGEGSSPGIAMEATAKIAVKRLINYHYILKIKPNMSLDQLVARPTLPTKKTVTSVHSSSRSDNKDHSSPRSDNKDYSSSHSDNKGHSSSRSDSKDHSSSRSDNKDHSSSQSDNKDHSSSRSDNKDHSSSRSDNKHHSSSRSDNKDHSSSRSDNKDYSSSHSDNKGHSSSRSDSKDHSSSRSDNKDHSSSQSDNKDHSSSRSDNKDHSSSRSDNKHHSSSRSDNKDHSSSRSDSKDHSSSRSDSKDHSSSRSDNKHHSSSRSDNKDHSSSRSDSKDHSSSRSDNKDHSSSQSDSKDHSSSRSDNKDHSSSRSDKKDHSSSRSDSKDHSSSRSDNKDHSSSRSDKKDFPVFSKTGTRVINKPGRSFKKRYKNKFVHVGKRLASSACPRESNQTRPAEMVTNVVNNSVSPIFLSWAQSIVKNAGKYSHNLVFSPQFSREELEIIKRVGQKADLRPSFRGNVEGEDLQLVLGRDIWTIARELLRVGGHNDNYQLIPPRNMGTLPSPICHSTTSNQQVPNSTQDSTTSNQTPAEFNLKKFEAGPGIGAPSISKEESTLKSKNSVPGIVTLANIKQEVTVKREHSVSKDQEMATLLTSEKEITVKREHTVNKDKEMATLSTREKEITVKREHSVSKDQEMATLLTSEKEITVKQEHTVSKDKEMATLLTREKEITVKREHSVSKDKEMATLLTSEKEITVKREHSVNKDQEMATLSTSEKEITVKQEHSDEKDQEMATLSTSEQEITVKQEHFDEKDQEMATLSTSEQEITVKREHSVSKDKEMATLSTSEKEITVKQEHSDEKDQEMATLSTSEQEITVKQEHFDEKDQEMMTLQSDKQENPCGQEHLFDPTLSPLFLTGPFGRLVVVDEFTTNYQKILTTTASSNKIILARQFGRTPSGIVLCRTSLNNQLLATGKGASQAVAAADAAQQSVKKLQQHYYTLKANCKYWSHKVVHPSMISPADSLEELVHHLAEQMGWKPSQEVAKSSRTSTGLSTFPRSFREWGEVLIETYKHIESWEDLTFSPDFSSEDKTVLARIALESGLLCRRVKTSNFLLLVVSKQFFLSKVIKSLITLPELNNKYQLLPPEIIPQLEVKDSELDKAMNSLEDEHQTLCDPAITKQMKDPLNCRVIESLTKTCDEKPKMYDQKPKMYDQKPKTCDEKPKTCDEKPKTCDEKPVALSSKLVGVDRKHSLLRTKLRTKVTLTNRPSFLKDPHLARVLPKGDYGQMVLLDSCDLGAVIEDVIRSLSESFIDYKFVHKKPTAHGSKRKEKECGLKLNTCRILIGGKTVTVGQHKKMRGATVIAAKKLMTKLKSQHFFVKGPRPRFLPIPFISDEKAFVSYAEKLLQEYSREETSSALVLKTDLGRKKEKILGRIAKRLDLKMYHSQPNIHSLVITKLTNFWTLVKLLASGDQIDNYKLIAPSS